MTEKSLQIQNRRLHYKVFGKGTPVVLLHGFAEDGHVWRHQQEELQKHYRLIIPDLPGSGQSDSTDHMSMEGLAQSIKLIMDQELQDGQSNGGAVMIGHSMGGYITLAFAEKYPFLLKGFGLFHSTAFADTDEKKATRRRGISFIQTHGSYEFIKQSSPNLFTAAYRIKNEPILAEMISRYSRFDPLALAAYYEAMIERPDRTSLLQSFNKPILFAIGKQDQAIPFEDSMKQCHLPARAAICIFENAAHMGMWEQKEESTKALLSFLEATV